jgi:hypothetical protein
LGWNWKGESPVQVLFDSPDSLLASFLSGDEPSHLFLIHHLSRWVKIILSFKLPENNQALDLYTCGVLLSILNGFKKLEIVNELPWLHSSLAEAGRRMPRLQSPDQLSV